MHGWTNRKSRNFDSHQAKRSSEKSHIFQKQILQTLYSPTAINLEPSESYDFDRFDISNKAIDEFYFEISKEYPEGIEKWKKNLISSNFSMWDSMQRSHQMFEKYCLRHEANYDLIIRMRYDVLPTLSLDEIISRHNLDSISVPINDMPDNMYCDWFAIGSPNLMKTYFNLFNCLPDLMLKVDEKYGGWCNEFGLYEHLRSQKIRVNEFEMGMKFH